MMAISTNENGIVFDRNLSKLTIFGITQATTFNEINNNIKNSNERDIWSTYVQSQSHTSQSYAAHVMAVAIAATTVVIIISIVTV